MRTGGGGGGRASVQGPGVRLCRSGMKNAIESFLTKESDCRAQKKRILFCDQIVKNRVVRPNNKESCCATSSQKPEGKIPHKRIRLPDPKEKNPILGANSQESYCATKS